MLPYFVRIRESFIQYPWVSGIATVFGSGIGAGLGIGIGLLFFGSLMATPVGWGLFALIGTVAIGAAVVLSIAPITRFIDRIFNWSKVRGLEAERNNLTGLTYELTQKYTPSTETMEADMAVLRQQYQENQKTVDALEKRYTAILQEAQQNVTRLTQQLSQSTQQETIAILKANEINQLQRIGQLTQEIDQLRQANNAEREKNKTLESTLQQQTALLKEATTSKTALMNEVSTQDARATLAEQKIITLEKQLAAKMPLTGTVVPKDDEQVPPGLTGTVITHTLFAKKQNTQDAKQNNPLPETETLTTDAKQNNPLPETKTLTTTFPAVQ